MSGIGHTDATGLTVLPIREWVARSIAPHVHKHNDDPCFVCYRFADELISEVERRKRENPAHPSLVITLAQLAANVEACASNLDLGMSEPHRLTTEWIEAARGNVEDLRAQLRALGIDLEEKP